MSKRKKTIEELLEESLVPKEEQPYEVPANWVWTKLGKIANYYNGKAFKSTEWSDKGRPIIRIQDLTGTNKGEPNYFEGQVAEKYEISEGDLLVSWSATLGAYIWNGPDAVLNQHIFKVESFIDKKYHYYAMQSIIDSLYSQTHGSGMVHITKKLFDETPFPLPSLIEQKRITEKVEQLLIKIEEAKQLIEEAKKTFELRRAAILDKAFSGELTGKWREENSIDQSVNELLEKIRIEKESTYLGLLDKANIEGTKKPTRPKKFQNEINHEYGKTLPNKWGYCTLGDVIYDFKYGTSEKSDYGFEGTPVIRIPNIGEEYINADDLKYLKENSTNFNALVLEGDILIVRSNGSKDLVGKCSIVQKGEEKYAFASYLIRIRPVLVVSEFILWLLKSERVREQFFSKSKSSAGINNINTEELATTIIPLPPIEEQREIVQKLKALLAKEDEIKKILDLDNYIKALKQSILSKAFRGELGTNAPSEENAIELLKEVLQERFK
ncbi:restriction endonuclease subunit S [Bacillus stratosphericus]|nr:restriction endonuclease subunit S [Bacillus stratosphericus]